MAGWRTKMLTALGGSAPVCWWAASQCSGAVVRRSAGAVEMERDGIVLRLAPKHVFFAKTVCGAFDAFAKALPLRAGRVVDFAAEPDVFNLVRLCLPYGARIEYREGNYWIVKDKRAMILSRQHLVYAVNMAEQFELYFSPLLPQERDGMLVQDYSRKGILQKYAKSGLEFEMASFPEEEEAMEDYFRWYRPKAGDLVFDMGAHCGVSTYHMAKLVGPEGRVVAFEPDPDNFAILERNLARHGLTNVMAQNAAIAGASGTMAFNAEGTLGSSLSSLMQRESVGSTVMVEAVTLEDAFARWGEPDFCKMDIEGAEIEALTAAGTVLRGAKTHFVFDTHHPRLDGTMTDKPVEALMRSYGYETATEAKPLTTTWARPRQA